MLFDINRHARLDPFIDRRTWRSIGRCSRSGPRNYRITVVTNLRPDTLDVCARDVAPGSTQLSTSRWAWHGRATLLAVARRAAVPAGRSGVWKPGRAKTPNGPVALGLLSPRGERSVLTVPIEVLMRVSSNPFFPYMARRVEEWIR